MAQFFLKGPLLCDVESDDFVAGEISLVVINTTTADPGFQRRKGDAFRRSGKIGESWCAESSSSFEE
jgi:hypothetical protein